MKEEHVTDRFLYFTEETDENKRVMRNLYERALKGHKNALVELMDTAYDCGYRDAYG
jgi:hypothetical protein